ncbi:MAG TPA: ATP-binding protein [Mycobacteriales bacterium]|nr:ATP-binding protein [Mycobacteriales bacterium]
MSDMAPGAAREFARASHCTDHAADVLHDALLLITELVTNSVLHGKPPILLAIDCEGEGLRVRVRDGSATPPKQRRSTDDCHGGRGLPLVERLSTAWGVDPVADEYGVGKAVWFTLLPPK